MQIKEMGIKYNFPNMKLVHSGGWKKLKSQAVDKKTFSNSLAEIFGTKPENIIDFYGMVEQLGVVFLDCSSGYKHAPDFADVIIRDLYSMEETPIGVKGLIEIVSLIPDSYPGQAILTEDVGEYVGVDDCSCGRKGQTFKVVGRAANAEVRGCGDIMAEKFT